MIPSPSCRLCHNPDTNLKCLNKFFECPSCGYIQLSQKFFVSPEQEKARYELHENDVDSEGYQNFFKVFVQYVMAHKKPIDLGLDYGSGPSSVVQDQLVKQNYHVKVFDPLFHNHTETLQKKYDYVICTEVIEHFKDPETELNKLMGLLKPSGDLFLKTGLTDEVTDFSRWHYHRDITHVGFFNQKSIRWVAHHFGLELIHCSPDVIHLTKVEA